MRRDIFQPGPQSLGLGGGLLRDLRLVHAGGMPVGYDELAGHDHVADLAGGKAEDPVAGQVLPGHGGGGRIAEHGEVGRGAGRDRAEQRLAEAAPRDAGTLGETAHRPAGVGGGARLGGPEERHLGLGDHVPADAVRAQRDARPAVSQR